MKVNEQPAVKDAYIARWMRDVATQLNATEGDIYTPTVANVANVASSTVNNWRYIKVGQVVFFSGTVAITPTATATTTQASITVPVSSAMASATDDASGTATTQQAIKNGAFVRSDGAGKLLLAFTSAGTTSVSFRVSGSYTVN